MHMQNLYARVWNRIFALYHALKSHLSHKQTRRSFAERKDAHSDTKNMSDMYYHFRDNSWKNLSYCLLSHFLRSCWRECLTPLEDLNMSLHYLPSRGIEWYQNQLIITYFAFFLCLFTLAGVKILHLHEYKNLICRCTAHDEGEQNGARINSISPTVSDLRWRKKSLLILIMTSASKKILRIKRGT